MYSILVLFKQTFFKLILEFGTISAATIKNAAEDGSPATKIFFACISYGPLKVNFVELSFCLLILNFTLKYFQKLMRFQLFLD